MADVILITMIAGEIMLYFKMYRQNKLSLFNIFFPLIVNIVAVEFVLQNSRNLVQFTKFLLWIAAVFAGIKFKEKYNLD